MCFKRNQGVRRNGYRSRWKTAGIIVLCLIFGLALGVGVGFLVQREFGGPKSDKSSSAKTEAKKQDKEDNSKDSEEAADDKEAKTESGSTVSSTTPAVSTVPAVTVKGKTPAEAMTAYLKSIGVESNGMMFSVVSASKTDPNWKLDKGVKGGKTYYFVVHYAGGNWTVATYGLQLTKEVMASVGAPADLAPSP